MCEGMGVRTCREFLVINSIGVEEGVALLIDLRFLLQWLVTNTPLPSKNTMGIKKRGHSSYS